MRKLSHKELLARQAEQMKKDQTIPFSVLLNDIRSLHNVGSIFRTADGAGVEKIWLCGITGIPPSSKLSKTALGAEEVIPWEYRRNPVDSIHELKNKGYQVVLLEQAEQSIPYDTYEPQTPVCLVIGNELTGVEDGLLPHCDLALEIEMTGLKNSLNAAVAFGIAAYHIRQKIKANVYE